MAGKNRSLYIVLGVVLVLVGIITPFAIYQMHKSALHISSKTKDFMKIGKNASVEQCADEVLSWASSCGVVKGICQTYIGKMMSACLVAQNRVEYCKEMGRSVNDSHFGFQKCYDRGYSKKNKACAEVYSTIGSYCLHVYGLARET